MRDRARIRTITALAILLTVFATVLAYEWVPRALRDIGETGKCYSNLSALFMFVQESKDIRGSYPMTLTDLTNGSTHWLNYFCPASRPSTLQQFINNPKFEHLDEWTDYIYIVSEEERSDLASRMPLLICPPLNHGGDHGYVRFRDGHMERIRAKELNRLIKEPWLRCHDANKGITQNVRVVVSKSLYYRSGGQYSNCTFEPGLSK